MKDAFDWKILELLQDNSRLSYAEIGRHIGMSPSAIGDRIQRLEEAGIIEGYTLRLNTQKIGYNLSAIITIALNINLKFFVSILDKFPEIIDCHRITGQDCLTIKAILRDSNHLENLIDRLTEYGTPSTSIVLSEILSNGNVKNLEKLT